MQRGGLTEKVTRDSVLVFRFVDVGKLPPPILQFPEVKFGKLPQVYLWWSTELAQLVEKIEEVLSMLPFNVMHQSSRQDDGGGEALERIYERLDALDASTAEKRAAEILNGLDFEACVWLEETLQKFERILVVTHSELEENQMKQYKWEQNQIANTKEYIAWFGHGSAKLARQAQSKNKTLSKMERGGLKEKTNESRHGYVEPQGYHVKAKILNFLKNLDIEAALDWLYEWTSSLTSWMNPNKTKLGLWLISYMEGLDFGEK
ncbi:ABC transporter F family member 1 [Tanacetum coccineum]